MYEKSITLYDDKDSKKMEIADSYQNLACVLWEDMRREEALKAWKTSLNIILNKIKPRKTLKNLPMNMVCQVHQWEL